jgi:hypothetical protein
MHSEDAFDPAQRCVPASRHSGHTERSFIGAGYLEGVDFKGAGSPGNGGGRSVCTKTPLMAHASAAALDRRAIAFLELFRRATTRPPKAPLRVRTTSRAARPHLSRSDLAQRANRLAPGNHQRRLREGRTTDVPFLCFVSCSCVPATLKLVSRDGTFGYSRLPNVYFACCRSRFSERTSRS